MFGRNTRVVQTCDAASGRRRGLGPFTGTQLTVIIVTFAVLVMFPVGAWAVSFSNVAITDPGGVHQAKVDATGHLYVGDGAGQLTVDGTVNARPTTPTKPIVMTPWVATASLTPIYGPATKPFAIGSLSITSACTSETQFILWSQTSTSSNFELQVEDLSPNQTVHVTYPIPLVTTPPPGGTVSLAISSQPNSNCILVSAVGYQT
jgi:hypothetical protein